jgi:hypothetical protein
VNAAGESLPPFLIFKGQCPPAASLFPKDTAVNFSKTGYIDKDLFVLFLQHFHQHAPETEGKRRFLILDGHTSHFSVDAISFCIDHRIELFCLPPHCSHKLQPLDTHFNKTLKMLWSNEVTQLLKKNEQIILSRYSFHISFNIVWTAMSTKRKLIIDSFKHCGLWPARYPTSEKDFSLSQTFHSTSLLSADMSLDVGSVGESGFISAAKQSVPSPSKVANPTHSKLHIASICSDEFLAKKEEV